MVDCHTVILMPLASTIAHLTMTLLRKNSFTATRLAQAQRPHDYLEEDNTKVAHGFRVHLHLMIIVEALELRCGWSPWTAKNILGPPDHPWHCRWSPPTTIGLSSTSNYTSEIAQLSLHISQNYFTAFRVFAP